MIHVRPELDHAVWVVIPPYWGGKSWRDEQEWADDVAASRWKDSGLEHQNVDLERSSAILALTAQRYGPGYVHPEQAEDPNLIVQVYLHLPHPADIPIPVRLLVAEAERLQGELPTPRQLVSAMIRGPSVPLR